MRVLVKKINTRTRFTQFFKAFKALQCWHVFDPYQGKNEAVKRAKEITKTSILDIIDYLMAGAGITREQAVVAMETIVHYVQRHPGEKLNNLIGLLFGGRNDRQEVMN